MGSFGPKSAPNVYQFQGMKQADPAALGAIGSIPGAVAATGYNPASTVQAGQQISGSVAGLPQYANQAFMSGFDPQSAYYSRALQQNTQQALANEAAQGITGTPYGAGLTNESIENFNQDWQNRMLQRQQMGAQTGMGLLGGYQSGLATGAGLGEAGGQFAAQIPQMQAQDYLNYLSGGTQAAQARTNAFGQAQNARNNFWGGIGQLGGALLGSFL